MSTLSHWVIILAIYDLQTLQQPGVPFISQHTLLEPSLRNVTVGYTTMGNVSWSCVEVACCVPNCTTPCFNPQISNMIPKAPLSMTPQTPISACSSRPPTRIGEKVSTPCCEKTHKHFLYSIVLPKATSTTTAMASSMPKPEICTPESATTANSSPTSSIDSAPIFTPTSPPERPSLRARRDTLSKLKIPESPPLVQEVIISHSKPSPVQPSSRNHNPSASTSMYPDMFLPMPSQSQPGSGNMGMNSISGAYNMTVSPMTSAYTPLFNRDLLAMSPISPLMYSNQPSPIMSAA